MDSLCRPELKGFDCTDFDPIDQWMPSSPAEVCYPLCLHIGLAGQAGSDIFYVEIVTPEAVGQRKLPLDKRHLVVTPYSWPGVLGQVQHILESIQAATWEECAEGLSRFFRWEFEDYRAGC